jgi:hypothetical protein
MMSRASLLSRKYHSASSQARLNACRVLPPWSTPRPPSLSFFSLWSYRPASVQLKMQSVGRTLRIVRSCFNKEPAWNKKILNNYSFLAGKSDFQLALDFEGASPKILICETRPRRITRRKIVQCTYTCWVWNTLGCFQRQSRIRKALWLFWGCFASIAFSQISSHCLKDFPLLQQNLLRTVKNELFSGLKFTNLGEFTLLLVRRHSYLDAWACGWKQDYPLRWEWKQGFEENPPN